MERCLSQIPNDYFIRHEKSRNHTLPMSDFVFELMERRSRNKTSEFVFPADSKTGYIYEPKKAVNRVVELSGVQFTLHDLRRTFATVADSLDLPAYAVKRLLNHKMNNDVTPGYIMKDVERYVNRCSKLLIFCLNIWKLNDKYKSINRALEAYFTRNMRASKC
jgi:integrase